MSVLKNADTIDEAVGQFYENPNKYSQSTVPSTSNPVNHTKETKKQVYSPPPYAPPTRTMGGPQRRLHTNAVIEAGHVRARDEVRFAFTSANQYGDELTSSRLTARDAELATERSTGLSYLQ
jgi:hypothetical protein